MISGTQNNNLYKNKWMLHQSRSDAGRENSSHLSCLEDS